jgi:hypothetical protein
MPVARPSSHRHFPFFLGSCAPRIASASW